MAFRLFKNSLKQGLTILKVCGLAVAFSALGIVVITQPVFAQTNLRVMAANTTSGNRQSYDPGEGTRIFQGLDPDVVLIQEFNFGDNSDGAIARWVESTFGPEFDYYREDGAQIPNGIISRYPILSAGEWNDSQVNNRDFAWAQIDIPGDRDLWAVSVHFLTRNASVRNLQANAVRRLVEANIPEGDYLTIGGDFNTRNSGEPALATLGELVDTDGPYPTDQGGEIGTNSSRRKPYDWVFADADLDPLEVPVMIGENTFPHGLVFDSREYVPLADVAPVLRGDSGATNMQHMAVIRDFVIPGNEGANSAAPLPVEIAGADEDLDAVPAEASSEILREVLVGCQTVRGFATEERFIHYAVLVPEGTSQLEVNLSGVGADDSDVDVYVRRGDLPTLTEYDFRPWLSDSEEQVVVNDRSEPAIAPGLWYVSVEGYIPGEYRLSVVLDKCDG